jgi:hypothetical protein
VPLFDPTIIDIDGSGDLTPEFISNTNDLVDRLRATKISILPLGTGAERTANTIRAYMHAHVRRCIEFVEAGHAEFYAGRSLVTQVCARANYENIAAFCDFTTGLIPLLEAGDREGVHDFVDNRAFATRIPSFVEQHGNSVSAKSILTQIDKMAKKYGEFRTAYDHLSDFVHPNGLGAVVHFVSIADGVVIFHDAGRNGDWAIRGLIISTFFLIYVENAIAEIEQRLVRLID